MTLVTLTTACRGVCSLQLQLCSVAANFNLLPRSPVDNITIILNTAATSNIPTVDADLVLVLSQDTKDGIKLRKRLRTFPNA